MPWRLPLGLFSLLCLLPCLLVLGPAGAEEEERDWKSEQPWKDLMAAEAKALAPLLKQAVKDDFRRQAWYLADRTLAAKPSDGEAAAALEKWSDVQLQEGMDPTPEFVAKRDKVLAELGDKVFHFGELLEGAGVDATRYYELNVRAHAYGSTNGTLLAALEQAGYIWLGTFLDHEKQPIADLAGAKLERLGFPLECDDAYLKVRVRWPEAKCMTLGPWRLITDLKPLDAVRTLVALEHAREHVVDLLGGGPSEDPRLTDVVLMSEALVYDKIGPRLLTRPEDMQEMQKRSSWYDRHTAPQSDRLLVLWRDRHNGWIGEDAVLLHAAAKVVARQHFGQKAGGWVQGRGAWLLDGLGGAMEGFARDAKTGASEIDPSRCWRLGAAKALRLQGVLLTWDKFVELDAQKIKDWPRRDLSVAFRGATYEAKEVDVGAAQATAFAVGLIKADKGKGARRLGDLLRDLMKRDSLPDIDKVVGGKKGRWQAEAEKAIDAATGR
jgi:hypothetical protein